MASPYCANVSKTYAAAQHYRSAFPLHRPALVLLEWISHASGIRFPGDFKVTKLTRDDLWRLLCVSQPDLIGASVDATEHRDGVRVDYLTIVSSSRRFPALRLTPPTGTSEKMPLIYCHAHGNRPEIGKTEVLEGRPALLNPPLGLALAQAGHTVLCPDMPGFGARQCEGTESALSKTCIWRGETLFGHMLEDLSSALDVVLQDNRSEVGSVGFSMGAFLSLWLAALRPEISACAHMCGVAALAPLVTSGAHDLHGPYLTVPGLLRGHDLPDVAALVAPRPQFMAAGLRDPLTPPEALLPARDRLEAAYGKALGLTIHIEEEGGHLETPRMRQAMMAFLADPSGER